MTRPEIAVIADVVSDVDGARVEIAVHPCAGATCFSVFRILDQSQLAPEQRLMFGDPVHGLQYVPATGDVQTFYDYECPPGFAVTYQVLSYGAEDQLLFPAQDFSEPVAPTMIVNRRVTDPHHRRVAYDQ